jgi:acyl-CoA synthetase (NDP forming)
VFMSAHGVPDELRAGEVSVPSYAFPEDAALALARAAHYGVWRERDEGRVVAFEQCRRDEASAVIATALGRGPGWLPPDEVARLLACYGLPLAEWRLVTSPEEAGEAARELAGPVALKAVAPTLVHKTEVGGVRLGLSGARAVTEAAREMADGVARVGHQVTGFLVQRMVSGGVEMIVGVVHDPSFGPVLACGAGGVAVELLKDVAVRLTPITDRDAAEMVRSLATFPLLEGYRGAPPADVGALEELLLRVSALVEAHPEVVEMDCNPVKVMEDGVVIVDARARVEEVEPTLPVAARRRR